MTKVGLSSCGFPHEVNYPSGTAGSLIIIYSEYDRERAGVRIVIQLSLLGESHEEALNKASDDYDAYLSRPYTGYLRGPVLYYIWDVTSGDASSGKLGSLSTLRMAAVKFDQTMSKVIMRSNADFSGDDRAKLWADGIIVEPDLRDK